MIPQAAIDAASRALFAHNPLLLETQDLPGIPPDEFDCCAREALEAAAPHMSQSPREQWTFTGREKHWGYTFLIWTRDDGKRFARVQL